MAISTVDTSSIALTACLTSFNVAAPVNNNIGLFFFAIYWIKGIFVKSDDEIG